LQSKTAAKDAVPFAGEIMASRWAFEALAVEQYKENSYMARFFDMEKEMAQARYRSDILSTELIGQVDLVDGWIRLIKPADEIARKLVIIKNEIEKLDEEKVLPEFQFTESLLPAKFNSEIAELAKTHLNQLKDFHKNRYQKIKLEKDQLINRLNKENGEEFLYNQKMKYHNKSLEVLVLNSETKEFFRETPHGYMQKIALIYKDPDFSYGRAHFLASEKNLFGYAVGTFIFNLGIIWLMIAFFYIALYYNWLRNLLDISSQFKLFKSSFKHGKPKN